jgi:ribosomal protein S18 acetylase RimI-like enzyme
MSEVILRPAILQDAPGIAACVCEAYVHYIERIGKQPGPMLEDYTEVVNQFQVHVAAMDSKVIGAIVLRITDEGFYIDNVAVRSSVKGRGVGRRLPELAEAEAQEGAGDCAPTIAHAGPYSTDDCRRIVPVVALLILR